MRLQEEFIRLPYTFDAARMAEEIAQFDERDWRPHPQGYPGNSALPLVSVGGDPRNDATAGPMRPTPDLDRCPYLREVLAAFGSPVGRTRLMRIDGNAEATPHVDTNYYWQSRVRIHVPIVTDPAVLFFCGTKSLHMRAGEAWIFDTWRMHNVVNPNPTRRVHLVVDTQWRGSAVAQLRGELRFEERNFPVVMSPEEQLELFALLDMEPLREPLARFMSAWSAVWRRHGERRSGWAEYDALRKALDREIAPLEGRVFLPNSVDAVEAIRQLFIRPALNPHLAPRIDRPVFIVSPPRSGSTLLFETLAQSPDFFTIGGESHAIIEGVPELHPANRGWDSNRLTADDATEAVDARFLAALRDRGGNTALPASPRMLEKTPKNALRVPFLRALYPDAFFIDLYRDPRATISSMLDAWRSGRFVTYPDLPEWKGLPWSLVLIPGWRELIGRPLAEIVATQWAATTSLLLDDLEALPPESWCVASYDALVRDPQAEIERLCRFVGVRWDRALTAPLPLSKHTLSAPDPDKWRRNGDEIDRVYASIVAPVAERAHDVFARPPARRVRVHQPEAFRSVHTTSFPEILSQLGVSLLVSTYQSGRLAVLRADERALNTHFRAFPSPMGIAAGRQSIAIGTLQQVWDYRNQPELTKRLDPPGKHDACFIPRNAHTTGDIRIHEIAFDAAGELWIVNTRFSALCTLDRDHSFIPRWRPPFITHLSPEDRCHLNGLAIVDGRPRFVTALGDTNDAHGWRANKAHGGVMIDVDSGETILRNLSMPHSPRWYAGRMWILESGKGTLATVDLASGRVDTIVELPGFTRGLAFAGPYGFVGLSQVRESNVFGGIPLTERVRERACGVWVVDLRNASIVAFVKFEDTVQEIFDLQVLHGIRYPELLEPDSELLGTTYVLPDSALADVAFSERTLAREAD